MFILKLQTLMLRNRPVLLKRRGSHTAFTDQQTFTTMKPLQPNKNKIIQNACLRELVDAVFVFLYIVSTHTLVCMYQYRRQKNVRSFFSGTTSLLLFLKKYPIRLYYQAFSMRRSVQKIMQKTVRRVGANVGDVTTFSCKFSLLLPNFLSMEVFSSSKLMYCADTTIFYVSLVAGSQTTIEQMLKDPVIPSLIIAFPRVIKKRRIVVPFQLS